MTDPICLGESLGSVTWAKSFTPYNLVPSSRCAVAPRRKDAKTCPAYRSPFCTPHWMAFPLGFRKWPSCARGRQVSGSSRRYWYVFPDILRANVERVAHIIMSPLSNVCMLTAANRKPMNLIHGQKKISRGQKVYVCVFFSFLTVAKMGDALTF